MKQLILDLEFNKDSRTIIQIGAIAYDTKKESVIDVFNRFIYTDEKIHPEISELTGITNETVKCSKTLLYNYIELLSFVKEYKLAKAPITWGSGDSDMLWKQSDPDLKLWQENPLGRNGKDVKQLYQLIAMGYDLNIKGSLEEVLKKFGIGWDDTYGKPHNALSDCHNTIRAYNYIRKYFFDKQNIINVIGTYK